MLLLSVINVLYTYWTICLIGDRIIFWLSGYCLFGLCGLDILNMDFQSVNIIMTSLQSGGKYIATRNGWEVGVDISMH